MNLVDQILEDWEVVYLVRGNSRRKDPIITSTTLKTLSGLEGLTSQHYFLTINYKNDPKGEIEQKHCFVKALDNTFETIRELNKSINTFDKEDFLYSKLLRLLKYERVDVSFAPEPIYVKRDVIVLDNLAVKGYKTTSAITELLDLAHVKVALKTLAVFQAGVVCYEIRKTNGDPVKMCDLFETHKTILDEKLITDQNNLAKKFFDTTVDGLKEIIKLIPEKMGITPEMFIKKLDEEIEESKQRVRPSDKIRNCLLHGDLWSNNMLFKYENDRPTSCVLIDFQTLKYGPLTLDVILLLVTNLRRGIRDGNFDDLLKFYFDEFDAILRGYGIEDVFTFDDFRGWCRMVRIPAKIAATVAHTLTFLSEDDRKKAFAKNEAAEHTFFGDKKEFISRCYKTNDLYKEVLTEDLVELRDFMFDFV